MNMEHDIGKLYSLGTKIWIPCHSEVWQTAEIIEAYDGHKLTIRKIKSRDEQVIKISSDEELPPLQNPDILLGENDLTSLSYLHEPAILYNLYCRFVQSHAIYTYCGIVLVAINPYEDLDIYGIDTMKAYRGQTMGSLDPHVFAVAEQAFNKMEIEKNNQSIIVSGESGAGKTVSAKYAMRYFAMVTGSETETQIEKNILASSPIMEAFGNAKTTRNDNSSRFGKYIELHFNDRNHITGASMRTYLLERSRVVHQAADERNYHIFYQLCSSRTAFPHLPLGDSEEYMYLASQPSSDNDRKSFIETVNALNTLGFSQEDQDFMWKVLASILHLGNIKIADKTQKNPGDSDSCYISLTDPSLQIVSTLLDINKEELQKWLCYRRIVGMKETYEKPMTAVEASGARDALAKHIYASLFHWLISIMNRTMCETSPSTNCPIIGVLDIYGFEMFEQNSFEQFCINYANEKLQQQFNSRVFKFEQQEYEKQGIEWKLIDFYDNQPCINLIEDKLGILDLLDEECRMPQGSDTTWTEKLYTKCTKCDRFSKPKFAGSSFTIQHFAGNVEYTSNGFLDKNKDTVFEDQVNLLMNGKNAMLRKIFMVENSIDRKLSVPANILTTPKSATTGATSKSRMLSPTRPICATIGLPTHSKQNKKTVGSQFRDSLNALMTTLKDTTPHYIRCVKPNDSKLPFEFDHQRAVDQLRACGVIETIKISAAGFPSRWTYVDFFLRYRVLLKSKKTNRDDPKLSCQRIVEEHIKTEDNYKYGDTKIFFREGQVAFLERKLAYYCSVHIQKTWRKYICKKKYLQIRNSILLIQRYGRGYLARRSRQSLSGSSRLSLITPKNKDDTFTSPVSRTSSQSSMPAPSRTLSQTSLAGMDSTPKRSSFVERTPSNEKTSRMSKLISPKVKSAVKTPMTKSLTSLKDVSNSEAEFVEALKLPRSSVTPRTIGVITPTQRPSSMADAVEFKNLKYLVQDCTDKLEDVVKTRLKEKSHIIYNMMKLQLEQAAEFKIKIMESHSALKKELEKVKMEKQDALELKKKYSEMAETLKMATLDEKMAELKAEKLQLKLELDQKRIEELTVDLELLKAEFEKGNESEEGGDGANSFNVKQLKQQNLFIGHILEKLQYFSTVYIQQVLNFEEKIEEKTKQCNYLHKSNEKLKARVEELASQLDQEKDKYNEMEKTLEIAEQKAVILQLDLHVVRKELAEKNNTIHESEISKEKLQRKLDETQQQLKRKSKEYEETMRKLDETQQQLKRKSKEYEETMDHLQAGFDSLKTFNFLVR